MNGRWERKEGSLDLLLNTLCDVFGSFIMIALILVLPTGISHITKPLPSDDTINRRISSARAELQRIENELAASAADPELVRLNTEKQNLEAAVKMLKEKAAQQGSARANAINASIRDVTKEDTVLLDKIRKAQVAQEAARNALEESEKYQKTLTSRIDSIKGKLSSAKKVRTQEMRLPRERVTSKGASSVIFRYGRIYPLQTAGGNNNDALKWTPEREDAVSVSPIEGKGYLASETAKIASWASAVSSDRFVACYVYIDSIDAFREFRKILQQKNMEIGWEPIQSGSDLVFSSRGTSPNPQ
jgi:hypothetical protein